MSQNVGWLQFPALPKARKMSASPFPEVHNTSRDGKPLRRGLLLSAQLHLERSDVDPPVHNAE